ncbi:hypothetical protein [Nevskia sp.]|uniref:hypothetical protein n=1 Tax=Nevskia sp. TaxID=1929292 RepID=UPI0025F384AC|nr:hypothetical protein [Nevskia sp.]
MNRILLVDLSERELKARRALESQAQRLKNLSERRDGAGLTPDQEADLERFVELLDSDSPVDEFYQVVASTYTQRSWQQMLESDEGEGDYILKHGLFGSQRGVPTPSALGEKEQEIAGICGLLQLDNIVDAKRTNFRRKVAEAQGEYRENRELFDAVFARLNGKFVVRLQSQIDKMQVGAEIIGCIRPDQSISSRSKRGTKNGPSTEGLIPASGDLVNAISARSAAAVVRRLAEDRVSANDPWLNSRIDNGFDLQTGVVGGAPASAIEIMLPDLEESVDVEIVKENLHAMQAHYFAFMLEEMRLFQVVEKIVDLFRQGLLPLGRGKAGDYLYKYYKTASTRITESERRDIYVRAFGAPGGDPEANLPNREFNELFLRFVSAVSNFSRQNTIEKLLRNSLPMAVSQEQVRKSARDLAANLSLHGYGIAYFAATELQSTILEFRDVLSDPEVKGAFGARDMWQVIDQVNVNYFGGAKNTQRFRTQARAGAIIIRWLANNHERLTGRYGTDVLSVASLNDPALRGFGSDQPTVTPSDWDLVQSCEQWLAVGGVQDTSIEQYSQPIESPVMTSRPIDIPPAARDVLSAAGISLPGM